MSIPLRGSAARLQAEAAEREPVIAALYAEGIAAPAIASRLGVSERSVQRALIRIGARQPRAQIRADVRESMTTMMSDGMPANWAAETLGTSHFYAQTVAQGLPHRRAFVREWLSVWAQIRRSPTLRELHDEFAPRA